MTAPYDAWMRAALAEATAAGRRDDVPVGAVVVDAVGSDHRARAQPARGRPATRPAHAEIVALRDAAPRARPVAPGRLHAGRHPGAVHDVRGRPRPGAGRSARLRRRTTRRPARSARCGTSCATGGSTTAPRWSSGVLAAECADLLNDFFARAAQPTRCPDGDARVAGRRPGPVTSSAVACPSGRRSTPRKRVRGQLLRGFKSHRHRQPINHGCAARRLVLLKVGLGTVDPPANQREAEHGGSCV